MNNSLVSIVLPIYNQADHIAGVVEGYEVALLPLQNRHELILVPNGCRDQSVEVCLELEQRYSSIRVVSSEAGGWGRAVRLGLKQAHGNTLCYTNSARTTAADLLLLVMYSIANPGALVKAHRRSSDSLKRKVGSFLYNLECRILFDLPTWDINATPKVFSRTTYEAVNLTSNGDLIDLEFFIKCKQRNIQVLEVPIYARQRYGGQSTTSWRSALRLYLGAFHMWQQHQEDSE